MKRFPRSRAVLAMLLGVALATVGAPTALAAEPTTATFEKSEVVYASLAADGAPEAVYVVNRFDVERAGSVVDHGDYTAVQNLTSEVELSREGDATVFQAEEGTLYYQGDAASTTLPWDVELTYELDGKRVSADQLAGASGKLAVHATTKQNKAVDPAFYDSFMMQITFTLPGDKASDVKAEGATVASAGEDATVAFTVLPGHEGDFTLTVQVSDFEMPGVQIAALPYSSVVEMPDTDEMVEGMSDLSDAVGKLTEGTSSLAAGVDELTSGAQDLSSGTAAFGQGLEKLSGSSGDIVGASSKIKAALSDIAGGLAGADLSQLGKLEQLPGGLTELAEGLAQLRQGAVALQKGYDQSLAALDGAIAAIPEPTLTEEQLGSLAALAQASNNPGDAATVNTLVQAYTAAQTVKGTYAATQQAFAGASTTIAALAANDGALAQEEAALQAMAEQLNGSVGGGQLDQLPKLAEGLADLAGKYSSFHDGLAQYASGLSALASNYRQLESGTAGLAEGTGSLAGGATELSDGMGELNASTVKLPEAMKKQIAEMTEDYDFPKFEPVSFASPHNAHVDAVQFVMSTAAIEKPEALEPEEPEQEQTIWDRFLALFQ